MPKIKDGNLLKFTEWSEKDVLLVNKFGIPEPIETQKSFFPDVVLVPLLAFDNNKNRLGYGKGYYDRFLAQCPENTLKVGLSFFDPVSIIEDINRHDIALDHAVTPRGVYTFL